MDGHTDQNHTRPTFGHIEQANSFAERMYLAAVTVDKYYTPLLFIFGTLGNSLSLIVFCMNAKYRSQSASYYLSALAISDTGFLVNLLAVWLENVHGGIITSGLMCPLVMYLGQVTCFMSVYLTVAFSIERYVAVHYPLSRPRICTRSKARKIIAALTGVALLLFSYAWMIAQVIELPSEGVDYEELFRDNQTPVSSSYNLTQDSSELVEFPVGRREKRQSFSSIGSASPEQDVTFVRNTDVLGKVQNCGNGSQNSHSKSIPFPTQNEQHNCTRLHLDGMTLKGYQGSYSDHSKNSGSDDLSANLDRNYELERNLTNDDFFFPGGYICSVPKDYFRISEIANYLDSVVTLIIPFFLITFFNVRIAICVWKLQRQRQGIIATSVGGADNINHHHLSSLRCSNKSSIHHKRKSSAKKRRGGASSLGRHHLSEEQCDNSLKENGVRMNNFLKPDSQGAYNPKYQRGTVRFQDARGRCGIKGTADQNNKILSSSSGSEENSVAENPECENVSIHGDADGIQELRVTPKRMDTSETLTATNFNSFCKPASFITRFGSGMTIKWKQKHKAASSPVTARPEFAITRERGSSSHHPSSNAAEVRVTKTLLLVSTVFLVLNLPAHAIRCAQFIQSLRGISEGHELLHAAQTWTNILFNTNFAVNFMLYCVSGKNFRKSLRNIILRKCNSNKLPNSWKSMSTTAKHDVGLCSKPMRGKVGISSKRNSTKEPQVTDIVELEERGEVPVHSNRNVGNVNLRVAQDVDESVLV